MTIKIEVDGLLKKYEDNDSKNLAKASKALSEKDTWQKSIIDENGEEVNITLLLAYEYSKGIENITNGIVSFDEALSKLLLIDYLIFVKYFFINLLYYFFVWQTSENDIFFKKLYLFHFFYAKI